ncbi:hypothetical protein KCP71_07160 [Salmonella enterica subsp. enterica]|nr:hypothetical protein KCP71_07160 [Salmonella enterica subsp. enterica]
MECGCDLRRMGGAAASGDKCLSVNVAERRQIAGGNAADDDSSGRCRTNAFIRLPGPLLPTAARWPEHRVAVKSLWRRRRDTTGLGRRPASDCRTVPFEFHRRRIARLGMASRPWRAARQMIMMSVSASAKRHLLRRGFLRHRPLSSRRR